MKRSHPAVASIGLVGAIAMAACGGGAAGGPYATKQELEELRTQYIATHDTMRALWQATDSMNKILEIRVIPGLVALDTTPPRPKCPPRCLNEIPPIPRPHGVEQPNP